MTTDLFDALDHHAITVHVLMDLQQRYPDLSELEHWAYYNRTKLRVSLLVDFATKNRLAISRDLIMQAIPTVDSDLLARIFDDLSLPKTAPSVAAEKGWVMLLSGGPATGKSRLIDNMELPESTILLDRDYYFSKLTPYSRLAETHPDHATHAVVCEAILYNERDAYRYALLAGAGDLLVDGTMSYLDLGREMIQNAQENGYRVRIINIDCDIELATRRARERAAKTGKTINAKLLYESHVRCASNFFAYQKLADATENWLSTEAGERVLIANSDEIFDQSALDNLQKKGELPLDNPSWPPNFDTFLEDY